MKEEKSLISIGYYKGEIDFSINTSVSDLDYEEMKALREMTVVAIGQMERIWISAQEKKMVKPKYED